MKYESQEELIGAYLDGRLSPSEQIRVEQLLDDQPEYRQLYEELRAVRHSLESLPRFQLDEDLSARVLRRAEREMLLGGQSRPAAPESEAWKSVSSAGMPEEEPAPARLSWRTWFWPCVTIAAALAIMFANQNQKKTNRLAKTEDRPATIGSLDALPPDKLEKPTPKDGTALATEDKPSGKAQPREIESPNREFAIDKDTPPGPQPVEKQPSGKPSPSTVAQENPEGNPADTATSKPEETQLAKAGGPLQNPSPANSGASFAEGVLLIKCDIHAEAVRNRTFQKLLLDEHIVWHDPDQDAVEQPRGSGARLLDSAVYVEATTRQVRNVLFQLMERSKDFAGLETRPQSGAAGQQVFLVYNRPNPAGQSVSPTNVVKSGTMDGVNARALPKVKSGKLGLNLDVPSAVRPPEPNLKATKPPVAKKSPTAKTATAGKTDGEDSEDALEDDKIPVRAMFVFRLVDADGKPTAE